jgi:diadenylate cyclase
MNLLMINLFLQIRFVDIVDILLVALLLNGMYNLLRGTVAINIFLGIVSIFLAWKIVVAFDLELLGEILGAFVSIGFIVLIIIFQPEIRQFLLALGTPKFVRKVFSKMTFLGIRFNDEVVMNFGPIISACESMASKKTGALIVITRQNELFQYVNTGVGIDAEISQALIENIFFKNSPLHDGAMIITRNRIKAAGCILPVTKKLDLPGRPGLRHRAGLGISEKSDAVVIVISEERGAISVATNGQIRTIYNNDDLLQFLEKEMS